MNITLTEKSYAVLINLLFVTIAAYLGVSAFYKSAISGIDVIQTPLSAKSSKSWQESAPFRPLSDYIAIEQRNLFKTGDIDKASTTPPPPQPDILELKETELKLKLWGTVSGEGEKTYAVIEDQQKRLQNLYRENDSVMGATIKRILREKVVLTVNGKDEVLAMEKTGSGEFPAGKTFLRPPANPAIVGSLTTESQQISLSRQTINEAMDDLSGLMNQAKIRPHFRNGRPDGLTISRIQGDSIFTHLGLRSGDIITSVDGQNIESVDDALKFYNQLKSSSNVTLQVRRRGRPKQIEYTIE